MKSKKSDGTHSELVPHPKTKFLKVKCPKCNKEQAIFSAPSRAVKCNSCGQLLAESTASKANLKSKLVKVLE